MSKLFFVKTLLVIMVGVGLFSHHQVYAALTLTSGSNATTTPGVATAITGFQIIGPSASTTPVKLRATSGTLSLSVISGVTMSGNNSDTVNLSGTVVALNQALSTLTYTRGSQGTDTLEISLVQPSEVFFSDNGHLYQYAAGNFTWTQALAAASSSVAYGARGYLATITSLNENEFVYTRITGDGWLGTTDSEIEKTWQWVTGPEAGLEYFQEEPVGGGGNPISGRYHAWAPGEPNDYGDGEDCGYMYSSQDGEWNDFPCSAEQGYVVEFGQDGDLPTVVAQNVSIVTADVPAVTSLSPLNGATTVSSTSNLVIGFSKTVSGDTGAITIYKSSDNSLIETIVASSSQVTGGGSASITINPSVTFEEGATYYVLVSGSAFKDSLDNFFNGLNASSSWVFTIGDETSPVISSIGATSTASTTVSVTWTTNELSSSRVVYGVTNAYGSVTAVTDVSPRVTTHTVSIEDLLPCTLYHYRVVSRDAGLNTATSTDATFITAGCEAEVVPTTATTTPITTSVGGSTEITEDGKTFNVTAPANATASSSSFVIQIKAVSSDAVLASIGRPTAVPNEIGTTVFDVKAIIDGDTILDSFNAEVTITYQYSDEDILGINESSLWLYHFTNDSWVALNDCSLNTTTNSISCTTPSFSIFGLFGRESSPGSGGGSATRYVCRDSAATNYKESGQHKASLCTYATKEPTSLPTTNMCTQHITSYIRFGGINNSADVKKLETFLNEKQGESLAVDGVFSLEDVEAVKRFQQKYASEVLGVWGLTKPTGYVYRTTLMKINSFYCNQNLTCPAFSEFNNMTEKAVSPEVLKTKILLSELGFYTGAMNEKFDAPLKASLKSFQETFSETMLKPWGIAYGTGYKYKTTNKFLNMIVGCETPAVELDGKGTFDY